MKKGIISNIGKIFMKLSPIKVIIIDDVSTYFNEQMLSVAEAGGNMTFERYQKCDSVLLKSLVSNQRDILILDIKGTVTEEIGKDGFDLAKHIINNTSTFVAITSAHKHHLKNRASYGDYTIEERLMTPVDFVDEMNSIIEKYLATKKKIYQKILFKIGWRVTKNSLGSN